MVFLWILKDFMAIALWKYFHIFHDIGIRNLITIQYVTLKHWLSLIGTLLNVMYHSAFMKYTPTGLCMQWSCLVCKSEQMCNDYKKKKKKIV